MNARTAMACVRRWFVGLRLRTQLLLVVNIVVGIATLGMLYLDYRASMDTAIRSKQASLVDEASAIAEAINALRHHGNEAVQAYLDRVCMAMDTQTSPGHRVEAWQASGLYFGSHTAHVNTEHPQRLRGEAGSEPTLVRVSELARPVVSSARATAARRAGVLFAAAIIAATIANTLLIRLVTTPVEGLAREVRAFGESRGPSELPEPTNTELATLTGELGGMMADLARREDDRTAQLSRARRLQSHLMAASVGDPRLAIEYHPADQVAGDFVDVLTLPNGDRMVCLADVVGHGVPAAMGAAILKALVVSLEDRDFTPATLLAAINRGVLRASLPEDFVSMIAIRLPKSGGPLRYASAGHETCYAIHADGRVSELTSTGMLLGIDPRAEFDDVSLGLADGDVLVLLSDGLSEAMNESGQLLGRPRIVEALKLAPHINARSAASVVLGLATSHLDGRSAKDDMTVVAVELSASTASHEVMA